MPPLTITAKGQITIPKAIRDKCHLTPGTPVTVEEQGGVVIVRAEEPEDPDQAWFWTPEWQEGIKRALEDVAAGRTAGPFANVEDMIESLHKGWPDD